jgi:hypothetical protein
LSAIGSSRTRTDVRIEASVLELPMIEQIEDVRPELYLVAFGQFDVLHRYVCAEKRPLHP